MKRREYVELAEEREVIARLVRALYTARRAAKAARGLRGWESYRRAMVTEALTIRKGLQELTKWPA